MDLNKTATIIYLHSFLYYLKIEILKNVTDLKTCYLAEAV